MTIIRLMTEGLKPLFNKEGGGGGKEVESDDFQPDFGDELTEADEKAIADMQRDTPMPEKDDVDPGDKAKAEAKDGKPRPKPAAKAEDDDKAAKDKDEEEPDDEDDEEEPDDKAPDGPVPRAAWLRAKQRAKDFRERAAAAEKKQAQTEGRLELLTQIVNGGGGDRAAKDPKAKAGEDETAKEDKNPFEEPDIDPVEDLMGALKQERARNAWNAKQHAQTAKELKAESSTRTSKEQNALTVSAYIQDAKALCKDQTAKGDVIEGEGGEKIPAFVAAYQYMAALRHAQLESVGVDNKKERDQIIADEEGQIVKAAIERKQSPAAAVFKLAKASGFKLPEKATAAPPAKSETEKKIEQIANAQTRTKSLSGGGAAYSGLTGTQIANMSQDEFDALADKLSQAQLDKLLGAM